MRGRWLPAWNAAFVVACWNWYDSSVFDSTSGSVNSIASPVVAAVARLQDHVLVALAKAERTHAGNRRPVVLPATA